MRRQWWESDCAYWSVLAALAAIVVFGVVAIVVMIENDRREWEAYSDAHGCSVVSTRQGRTRHGTAWVHGSGSSGSGGFAQTTQYESGETCYRCEPGPLGVDVCREGTP